MSAPDNDNEFPIVEITHFHGRFEIDDDGELIVVRNGPVETITVKAKPNVRTSP